MRRREEAGLFVDEAKNFNDSIHPFYGIEEIDCRYRGMQSDPGVSFKGDYTEVSWYYLEDCIYDGVKEIFEEKGVGLTDKDADYMDDLMHEYAQENKEELINILKQLVVSRKMADYKELVESVTKKGTVPYHLQEMADEIIENESNYINIFGKKYGYAIGNVIE